MNFYPAFLNNMNSNCVVCDLHTDNGKCAVARVMPPMPKLIGRAILFIASAYSSSSISRVNSGKLCARCYTQTKTSAVDAKRQFFRFSRHYCNKVKRIAGDIGDRLAPTASIRCGSTLGLALGLTDFIPVTVSKMTRLIKPLPPKSCSLDCMPTSPLKTSIDALVPLLTLLDNMSLTSG
jgi:hypothetical protein